MDQQKELGMKFKLEPKELGKLLSELRQKAGLSQAKISRICEVNSPQYISNIERGQCLPSLKILKTMLSEYKLSEQDRKALVDMFMQAARKEVEDIFGVEMTLSYNISEAMSTGTSKPSYLNTSPSLNYTLAAIHKYSS